MIGAAAEAACSGEEVNSVCGMTLIPACMHIDFDLSEAPDVQLSFPGR